MGRTYFTVQDITFPVIHYGWPAPNAVHYSDPNIASKFGPEIYINLAVANDMSLLEWSLSGTKKNGVVEFRDYEYPGSLRIMEFFNGFCQSYSETLNKDDVNLPRVIVLYIIPDLMIYYGEFIQRIKNL